jgi:hypothetical protein
MAIVGSAAEVRETLHDFTDPRRRPPDEGGCHPFGVIGFLDESGGVRTPAVAGSLDHRPGSYDAFGIAAAGT